MEGIDRCAQPLRIDDRRDARGRLGWGRLGAGGRGAHYLPGAARGRRATTRHGTPTSWHDGQRHPRERDDHGVVVSSGYGSAAPFPLVAARGTGVSFSRPRAPRPTASPLILIRLHGGRPGGQ